MKATFETSVVPLKFYVDLLMEKVKDSTEQGEYWIEVFEKEFYGTKHELRGRLTRFLKDFDWSEA